MKERLLQAHGTLGLAWRNYMDPKDLSQIPYTQLNATMRRDNNHLNPGKIWDHLVSFDLMGMVKGSGVLNPGKRAMFTADQLYVNPEAYEAQKGFTDKVKNLGPSGAINKLV